MFGDLYLPRVEQHRCPYYSASPLPRFLLLLMAPSMEVVDVMKVVICVSSAQPVTQPCPRSLSLSLSRPPSRACPAQPVCVSLEKLFAFLH